MNRIKTNAGMTSQTSRRKFLRLAASTTAGGAMLSRVIAADQPDSAAQLLKEPGLQLLGNRFFTFNTVVRVRQTSTPII